MSLTGTVASASDAGARAGAGESRWWERLFEPVDIASLVFFRVAFGAVMLAEVLINFATDRVRLFYLEPKFHFKYYGFGWVELWAGDGMYWHFAAVGVAAVLLTLGVWYRVSAVLLFVGYTYIFLVDQAYYQNHLYLLCLLSLLMIVVPAHRAASVDAWRSPELRSEAAPAWALWVLRAQIGMMYFYGGLAKLNADWLGGWVLRTDLAQNADFPLVGRYLTERWAVVAISWAGLLLDLLIFPALLWRRTRVLAVAAAVAFHVTNSRIFTIEVFPWLGIAGTLLFFRPDWPRRLLGGLWPGATAERGAVADVERWGPGRWVTVGLLGGYLAVQLAMPLRHWLYPGDVNWTEEGSRFAWQMKAKAKYGAAMFYLADPERKLKGAVDPSDSLNDRQHRILSMFPDMVLQFAHFFADQQARRGHKHVEVRVRVGLAMNGREPQLLVDPEVNLAAEPRNLRPAKWILPLTEPRRRWSESAGDRSHEPERRGMWR